MPENEKNIKYVYWLAGLAFLVAAIIAIVSVVMVLKNKDNKDYQFRVTAEGKVTAVPDIATLRAGVYTAAKQTAAEAVKANTKKMNQIIQALKEIGIEKKDIKTINYRLNPVYDWTDKTGRRLKGYEVRQELLIKIRDLDKIGQVIQTATAHGANQIGNINFTIDDQAELKAKAVGRAIEKAKAKARRLAKESGLKLGKVINVIEGQSYVPTLRAAKLYAEQAIGSTENDLSKPTIEAGQQEVKVNVTVVYEVE